MCIITPVVMPLAAADCAERLWQAGPEQLVVWLGALAALATLTWYVVGKIRSKPAKKEPPTSQWLSKCRELHSKGGLSDEEFRTIKTQLSKQLQNELSGSDEAGCDDHSNKAT
jgi:hypothetical protein